MKPLIVLITAFIISFVILKLYSGKWKKIPAGNIAMACMLLFTATGHFLYSKGMALMIPDFIPVKEEIVLFTGLLEIAAAIGLLIPKLRSLTGFLLIIFFFMILPANIYAALKNVDYEKAVYTGSGVGYLWFRIPLQLFFIVWVFYFSKPSYKGRGEKSFHLNYRAANTV